MWQNTHSCSIVAECHYIPLMIRTWSIPTTMSTFGIACRWNTIVSSLDNLHLHKVFQVSRGLMVMLRKSRWMVLCGRCQAFIYLLPNLPKLLLWGVWKVIMYWFVSRTSCSTFSLSKSNILRLKLIPISRLLLLRNRHFKFVCILVLLVSRLILFQLQSGANFFIQRSHLATYPYTKGKLDFETALLFINVVFERRLQVSIIHWFLVNLTDWNNPSSAWQEPRFCVTCSCTKISWVTMSRSILQFSEEYIYSCQYELI